MINNEEINKDLAYSAEYDAYYNPTTNEWTESTCDDVTCEFCTRRPQKPLKEQS